jgi:AraC-like DNA-binding protein
MAAPGTQASVSAPLFHVVAAFMRSRGLDYPRAARAVGIDPAIADDSGARIPLRAVAQLLENVARETDNDAFGAQLGETFQVGTVGTLDYIISNAPTLRVALHDYLRFLGLVADGFDVRFEERPRVSYMIMHLPPAFGPRVQLIDLRASARLVRIRHMLRDPSVPLRVDLERKKPKAIDEFRRIFGAHLRFRQPENRIGIPTAALDRKLPAADPNLYRVVVLAGRKALAEQGRKSDIVSRVVSFVGHNLPHGKVDVAAAAKAVGLSPADLRQALERRRVAFRGLLEDTRRAMAEHYINETQLPMTEIAFLLGYSELSAFSRATKKWFGDPARELRKRGVGPRH